MNRTNNRLTVRRSSLVSRSPKLGSQIPSIEEGVEVGTDVPDYDNLNKAHIENMYNQPNTEFSYNSLDNFREKK